MSIKCPTLSHLSHKHLLDFFYVPDTVLDVKGYLGEQNTISGLFHLPV